MTVRELGGCMGPIWPSYFRDCTSVIVSVVYCENDASGSAISVHNLLIRHTVKMTFTCCKIRPIPFPPIQKVIYLFSYIPKHSCKKMTLCFLSLVHGRLCQHHTDFLLLHPAAVCPIGRVAPLCLCARAVQQEVRL